MPAVFDPFADAAQAAEVLAEKTGVPRHDIALICGSGWNGLTAALGETTSDFPSTELPGFLPPTVKGHEGRVRSILTGVGCRVLVVPRKHLYERDEHGEHPTVHQAVHSVRTAAAAGCRTIVLTSAVGGLNPMWPDGTAVFVGDHISLYVPSPSLDFVQCHEVYPVELRARCKRAGLDLPDAVLVQVVGPHFESPAEARALRALGAQIVGMSGNIEALAAVECGMRVLGISVITDQVGTKTGHDDVLAVVRVQAAELAPMLAAVIPQLLQ